MTAVAGINEQYCHVPVMVLADDIFIANNYVAGLNHKWSKPELQAAAAAMVWIM